MTDDRQTLALVRVGMLRPRSRASLGLSWLRTRTVRSLDGRREPVDASHRPRYGNALDSDRFYVLWGDDPLYRESGSDVLTLRGDGRIETRGGGGVGGGLGLTYEDVSLREMDWASGWVRSFNWEGAPPVDSIRSYQAWAPGGFAYVQGRWISGGMILNAGLRAEYFTAGPQATLQTLPGDARETWTFGPRLGIAYPLSVRDAFSLSYVRLAQAPARDFLYDRRTAISDRQPLGNPALEPATVISYEAALKHVIGPEWALQASVFYRDVFGQVGALDYQIPRGTTNLRYENADQSHVVGFEWSVLQSGLGRRFEARYTWMDARGNESRAEGDPYGPVRSPDIPPTGDRPLSWDRRHSLVASGAWPVTRSVALAWTTAVSSPLPWTPKPRREEFTELGLVNSRRLAWSEATHLDLTWTPPRVHGLFLGLEVRNLFDNRAERAATVDGYPNPVINTLYDDYGAYRTETGLGGGAYWSQLGNDPGHWVPVHDPRLFNPPRAVRMSVGARW
jgi:outer membrane receptor protein involved in Fe transport